MSNFINQLKEDDKKFKRRSNIIKFGIYLFLVAIFLKISYLQIPENDALLTKYDAGKSSSLIVKGERGEIIDSSGEVLAVSVLRPSIFANPRAIKDRVYYSKILSDVLKIPKEEILNKLKSKKYFVYIKRHATHEQWEKISKMNLAYVGMQLEPKRTYPHGHLAGQVLGHTDTDQKGIEGLELKYNKFLRGSAKRIEIHKDAFGKVITKSIEEIDKPNKGHDIHLTIISKYQLILEDAIAAQVKKSDAVSGFGMIMNPNTGEIYAMVSYPFFNPNNYSRYGFEKKKNLPVLNMFEPGSVMKSFLVASALNEGVIDEDAIIDCEKGVRSIGGTTIKDLNPRGKSNITEILVYSSNICASKITELMSKEKYYNYLKSFGFGAKTNINVPSEIAGILAKPEKWSEIQRANIAFGQGISVSSIQLAQALSIIANGGTFIKPYLVKLIVNSEGKVVYKGERRKGNRVLRYETSKKMRKMLKTVLQRGAKRALIEGVNASGKTGTAQFPVKGGYDKHRNVVSIIGFLPSENPQLVAVITIDYPKGKNAYGGRWAAPVFKKAMGAIWLDENNIEKVTSSGDVPSFIGRARREALAIANINNMKIKIQGSGFVQRQNPGPGEEYNLHDEIKLFLDPGI